MLMLNPPGTMAMEMLLALGILSALIYCAVRWVRSAPMTADPWGAEVERTIQEPETPALCHRCLTPQKDDAWFCPKCGSAVGPYNNYMPYVIVFSQGEVYRAGVMDHVRPSILVVCGYLVYSVMSYWVFAPIYLYRLYRNLSHWAHEPESPKSPERDDMP
jgi:hypothetical protein